MAKESITTGGAMDFNTALQKVLKNTLIHDGLAHGIRKAAKALDNHQAHLCVLPSGCDEPMYARLVEALCAEHQINLIKVDNSKKLGQWVGLCKTDKDRKPHKVVGYSCVVVKVYGKESQAKDVIKEYFQYKKFSKITLQYLLYDGLNSRSTSPSQQVRGTLLKEGAGVTLQEKDGSLPDSKNSLLDGIPNKNTCTWAPKVMHRNVHSSTVQSNPKLETTQVSNNCRRDKEIMYAG
ncbi:LOW QUALITY PROTEIN: 40S ribosomal protein S12-like [Ursus maritimus]|uniref:40S ribosomal protein S12 n=1 Tax=Ursus maritimus TaxID=29073 RepID=A0A8M1FCP6_URSMA|nr:LOW QUALITY PROTEIN: 40S ribosomal protein S12-like [Ursus maritimus]